MRTVPILACGFVAGLLFGQLANPAAGAQFREIKRTTLLRADLDSWCDGKEVIVELNEAGPGTSGRHYHPGHSFTWVVAGTETYSVDGKPSRTVKTGDVLHETPMEVHTVDNKAPVRLFSVRIVEKGKPDTVRLP